MEYIKTTAEILAYKALNRNIDKTWVEWAVAMLMAGYETENLVILAGEMEPYNQFELHKLTSLVLKELDLDLSDRETILKKYTCYLIEKALNNETEHFDVLNTLKDLCIELKYESYLYDFFSLYYAKDDLLISKNQWYWEGATQQNIDSIINEYFINYCTHDIVK